MWRSTWSEHSISNRWACCGIRMGGDIMNIRDMEADAWLIAHLRFIRRRGEMVAGQEGGRLVIHAFLVYCDWGQITCSSAVCWSDAVMRTEGSRGSYAAAGLNRQLSTKCWSRKERTGRPLSSGKGCLGLGSTAPRRSDSRSMSSASRGSCSHPRCVSSPAALLGG